MVADKIVRTKYGIRTIWYRTKWYGQNSTDSKVWTKW